MNWGPGRWSNRVTAPWFRFTSQVHANGDDKKILHAWVSLTRFQRWMESIFKYCLGEDDVFEWGYDFPFGPFISNNFFSKASWITRRVHCRIETSPYNYDVIRSNFVERNSTKEFLSRPFGWGFFKVERLIRFLNLATAWLTGCG